MCIVIFFVFLCIFQVNGINFRFSVAIGICFCSFCSVFSISVRNKTHIIKQRRTCRDLIDAGYVSLDDGPIAVLHIRVESDAIIDVGQVDLVGRVDPSLELHCTQLVVERVEHHVEGARDGVHAAGLPARCAVVTNGDHELSVVVFVE